MSHARRILALITAGIPSLLPLLKKDFQGFFPFSTGFSFLVTAALLAELPYKKNFRSEKRNKHSCVR